MGEKEKSLFFKLILHKLHKEPIVYFLNEDFYFYFISTQDNFYVSFCCADEVERASHTKKSSEPQFAMVLKINLKS